MNRKILILLASFLVSFTSRVNRETICTIQGTVINPQDTSIILYKPNEDPFGKVITIPIINGKFKYTLNVDAPTGYDLMYGNGGNRAGRHMTVFLEGSNVDLTIYPED